MLNQTEYRVYIKQYANSREELAIFKTEEEAMKVYDNASETNYHTHIEYYLNGKFQYNVCSSCKQEYIHNQNEKNRWTTRKEILHDKDDSMKRAKEILAKTEKQNFLSGLDFSVAIQDLLISENG